MRLTNDHNKNFLNITPYFNGYEGYFWMVIIIF